MTPAAAMPNLFTQDMPRALAFYVEALGLEVRYRFPDASTAVHVVLAAGSSSIALTTDGPSDVGLVPTHGGHPMELVLFCPDVDAAVRRLQQEGAPVVVEAYDHVGGHRRAYVTDPDGNWLALVDAPPPDR